MSISFMDIGISDRSSFDIKSLLSNKQEVISAPGYASDLQAYKTRQLLDKPQFTARSFKIDSVKLSPLFSTQQSAIRNITVKAGSG
jgi:hypothetical protein